MAQIPTTRSQTRAGSAIPNIKPQDKANGYHIIGDPASAKDSDDSAWEDEAAPRNGEQNGSTTQSQSAENVRSTTPRRRRRGIYSRKQSSVPPSPKPPRVKVEDRPVIIAREDRPAILAREDRPATISGENRPAIIAREDVVNGTLQGAAFTARYVFDVFSTAIHLLRKPLSILLFLWLLAFVLGRISHNLKVAFSPLCILPGISNSVMCRWDKSGHQKVPQWADYPRLVNVQSKTFEQLMDESMGGTGLSLEIKKAEMATTDLVTLVKVSDLKAKDTLASSLTEFVDDAKKTGRGLQKLHAKIGGAVDNIMAINDYALHSIEAAQTNRPSVLQSLIPWRTRKPTAEIVTETFAEALNVLSTNMERLIIQAERNLVNLDALEERLSALHELVSREDSSMMLERSELLADLWTQLGGNKKTLRNFNHHLTLLKDLGSYRKQALVHVVAALQTLRALSEDMEDLRERVATPELVGSKIPVEVHMKSIQLGLDRLREGRIKAKQVQEDAMRKVMGIDGSDVDD